MSGAQRTRAKGESVAVIAWLGAVHGPTVITHRGAPASDGPRDATASGTRGGIEIRLPPASAPWDTRAGSHLSYRTTFCLLKRQGVNCSLGDQESDRCGVPASSLLMGNTVRWESLCFKAAHPRRRFVGVDRRVQMVLERRGGDRRRHRAEAGRVARASRLAWPATEVRSGLLLRWERRHAHAVVLDDREVPRPVGSAFQNRYRYPGHASWRPCRDTEQDHAG